ncbi:MAG: hypothetical protein AMXMBFR46_18280 [Acidimicrobiia bacterium]
MSDRKPPRWRSITAVALVVLAAILAPLTVTARWVHDHILDTDGYVETVAPLADDPVITDALAKRVVDELFARADVQRRVEDLLPGPVDALGRTFTNSLRNLATNQAESFLASDRFRALWEEANRIAHEQVVAMFSGDGDAVSQDDGQVVLDLGVVADKVRERLVDGGVGVLRRVSVPKGVVEVTLFRSDVIPELQTAFSVLDDLAAILPVAFLVCLAGAIAVAPRRRRIVIALGLSVAAATSLLLVAVNLVRRESLDHATEAGLNTDAAKAVFDALVVALREASWIVIVAGLVVALVTAVSNPTWIGRVVGRLRGSSSTDAPPISAVAREHRNVLLLSAIGIALVVLAVWPTPTLLVVVVTLVVLAFVLGLIVALARMAGSGAGEAAHTPEDVDQLG